MQHKDNYTKTIHRVGRIGSIVSMLIMVGIPFVVGAVYDSMPPLDLVIKTGGSILLMFIPLSLSEVISYSPILGSSAYITFITGNVTNLKIPVALNALKVSDQEQATEAGDAIIAVAVGVSSIVTMLIIALGVVLMVPLAPVLNTPAVKTATGYMMPALMGALILSLFSKKSGSYIIENRMLSLVPCAAIMVALILLKLWNPLYQGVFIVAMIPVTVLTARKLYTSGVIKVFKNGVRETAIKK